MAMTGAIGIDIGFQNQGFGGKQDTRSTVSRKISDLEQQKKEYENKKKLSADSEIDNKISGLEKRITNLKNRLQKLDEKDGECETCKNRKYQDGSDDPGVSFKNATKISPDRAAAAVRGHENEHVVRNKAKAEKEGREIVSQSVSIKTGICPECHKTYVEGGETRTVTKNKTSEKFNVGKEDAEDGKLFNTVA